MAAKTKARRRQNQPYTRSAPPTRLGTDRLRFTLIHGSGSREVGEALTAVRWDDAGMELTGTVEAQAPLSALRIADGDRLRCEQAASADAPFKRLWTLALTAASDGIQRSFESDKTTGTLESTLPRYRANTMDFSYRKDKAHPRGWTCDQIARDVARRAGIPLGKITRGTHRITNLVRRNADPVDVILVAYRQEREQTGRLFFISWDGNLHITVLTRSRFLLELLPVILSGTYGEQRRDDFATVLDVRTSVKHGKRTTRKVHTRVVDAKGVRQYGRIVKSVSPKGISSEAEARRWARASLQRRQSPKRELTITVPLMPLLRRGDAMRVDWPEEGLKQIVYVRSASHEWTSGGGSTTIVARFDDPFVDQRQIATAKAKRAAAKKRRRKATKPATSKPKPKTAAKRGNR